MSTAPLVWSRAHADALTSLDFELPPALEAHAPPEARGLSRDEVGLMVSHIGDDSIEHASFCDLKEFLHAGDVLVVNTSATVPAALCAKREDGSRVEIHLSTRLPAGLWSVELRQPHGDASRPLGNGRAGEVFKLVGGGALSLYAPYREDQRAEQQAVRLWIAGLQLPLPWTQYLERYGFPIRYDYVEEAWPIEYYQTVFARDAGSAEMPSAARPFSSDLVADLVSAGIQFAPLLLHAGVSSLEDHEPPYEEYYRVGEATAALINAAREKGGRIVAVGTTVVRALESVAGGDGRVYPGSGWTRLIIDGQTPLRAADALLTGLHEPRATHAAMLRALAGEQHLRRAYEQALHEKYLWHEFGDSHLILP